MKATKVSYNKANFDHDNNQFLGQNKAISGNDECSNT